MFYLFYSFLLRADEYILFITTLKREQNVLFLLISFAFLKKIRKNILPYFLSLWGLYWGSYKQIFILSHSICMILNLKNWIKRYKYINIISNSCPENSSRLEVNFYRKSPMDHLSRTKNLNFQFLCQKRRKMNKCNISLRKTISFLATNSVHPSWSWRKK